VVPLSVPLDLLACPQCRGALDAAAKSPNQPKELGCVRCHASYPLSEGVLRLRLPSDARTEAVRAFYSQNPFPGYAPSDDLATLRARASRSAFARALDNAVPGDARIVEVGCGTGQMSLFLANADRVVIGADLTSASLELGARASRRFAVRRAFFVETDLRQPGLREAAFDVVYSSGVLHHTPIPRASFAALAKLAKPGGVIVVGLYNLFARLPHRLRRGLARITGRVFWDPALRDRRSAPARRDAWLRDQYFHPEEHCHTVDEVKCWFRDNGVEFLRTYPNTLFGENRADEPDLFSSAEDDWWLENWICQLTWAVSLAHEGGLFVTIGRRERST
jgi:SAM-dependent methyltransferase